MPAGGDVVLTSTFGDVAAAVWPGRTPAARPTDPARALALARANHVRGALVRRYPGVFAAELDQVRRAAEDFDRALVEATTLLRRHGVEPLLIKYFPEADHGDFDLVVGDALPAALAALRPWAARTATHPLEPGKVLVYSRTGPAAHLHRQVSWWGVPAIDGDLLRAHARDAGGWLVPDPVDDLRVRIAHALFQNLALDLSELLALRPLLDPEAALVAPAVAACRREGWVAGFRGTVAAARDAIGDLDRGRVRPVPVMLPPAASCALAGHAGHLLRHGHPGAATWEVLLRPPLLLAKARRVLLGRRGR